MKKRFLLTFIIFLLFALPLTVFADMGPKPTLTVNVKNPPEELYYLDLLIENNRPDYVIPETDNEMVMLLYSYVNEGWIPALQDKDRMVTGDPVGKRMLSGIMSHEFGYMPPDRFRIIIVTKSGDVTVTDVITTNSFHSEVTFDYATGKIAEKVNLIAFIIQFIFTLTMTLLVEGILLSMFGFDMHRNYKVFLIINLITQIFLAFCMSTATFFFGLFTGLYIQFILEPIILITETIIYMFILKGHTKIRRVFYGITANLVSWIGGFFLTFILAALNVF